MSIFPEFATFPGRTIRILPSGLTVLLQEVRQYPVIHFNFFVRTGIRDETPEVWGMSHFLEHMLFNGNEDYSREELSRTLFEIGGDDNATTREDVTNFYILVTSDHYKKGLVLLRSLVTSPILDDSDFQRERDVVKEEIRLYLDSPADTIEEYTEIALFKHLGYDHPILGTMDSLDRMTTDSMRAYYKANYTPGKSMLIAIGDFDSEELLTRIENEFSSDNRQSATAPPGFRKDDQAEPHIIVKSSDIDATYMAVYFKGPPLSSMETFALDILMEALGGCRSARLNARLFEDLNIVTDIDAYNQSYMDASTLGIDVELSNSTNIQPALDEILAILSDVVKNGFESDEIERARTRLLADRIYKNEEFIDLCDFLGMNVLLAGTEFAHKYRDRISSVTHEQVLHAARKYLLPEKLAIGIHYPEKDGTIEINTEKFIPVPPNGNPPDPPCGKITTPFYSGFKPGREIGPVLLHKLPNGVKWVFQRNPINPTVVIDLYIRGGLAHETRETNGIGEVMQRALWKGTTSRPVDTLNLAIDTLGAGIVTDTTPDYCFLRSIFLSRDFETGIDISSDMLLNPAFPDGEIARVRDEVIGAIIQSRDSMESLATERLKLEVFGPDHPYGRPELGTIENVSALTPGNIRDFHHTITTPENLLVIIVGDVTEDTAAHLVNKKFGHLEKSGHSLPDFPSPIPIKGEKILRIQRDKSQVKIAIGGIGPSVFHADFPATMLMNTILGRTPYSRMFQSLREDKALAYNVYTSFSWGKFPGLFRAFIGTAPANVDKAIDGIRHEYRKLAEDGPTSREIKSARAWLRGNNLIWKQGNQEIARWYGINEVTGLPFDHDTRILDTCESLSDADIISAARKYADPDNIVISICGPV